MYLARRLNNIPFELDHDGSVATIGSCDGVHQGRRKSLDTVLDKARADSLPSVVTGFNRRRRNNSRHQAHPLDS